MVDKLPSKDKQFSEWYVEVIRRAQLADYAPIQGCIVFMPNSYEIWENIQTYFNKKIKALGVRNCYFPMFIPEKFLKKEADHFEGFTAEVAWITHGGSSKLAERLAIRPTSETIMYNSYSDWVRSHRDLPLLLNQWCSVVRWETKATKPFLRTREFLWQEGHTVHTNKEETDKEVFTILKLYKQLAEGLLAIPVVAGIKTDAEKFAGALMTTTIEALMPDCKALQAGTSHNLGQHFAKVFDIKFIDEKEKEQYAWQASWGFSTRLIGAVIMVHGDDKGLVLPPRVAPTKAVIVPIFFDDSKKKVLKEASKLHKTLNDAGIITHLDDRDIYTAGWKFNEWELRGTPIRIELGPKDIAKSQVVLVRRDTGEKEAVKLAKLEKRIPELLEEIHASMFKKAKKFLKDHTFEVKNYKDFTDVITGKKGMVKACWCGDAKCEDAIAKETQASIRCIPLKEEKAFSKCIHCNKKAKHVAYFARAY